MRGSRGGRNVNAVRRACGAAAVTACCLALAAPASASPGDILFGGCLSGDTALGASGNNACTLIGGAQAGGGAQSGLDLAWAVAISPDGASLYALSLGDDAIL